MAAPTTSPVGINTMVKEVILPYMVDQFTQTNTFMNLLFKNHDMIRGGNYLNQPIMTGLPTQYVTRYTGAQTIPPNFQVNERGAVLNMKFYAIDVSIAGTDDARDDGPEAVFDMAATRMAEAELALRDSVGADIQGDGTLYGGLGITGMDAAIDAGTVAPTYCAIPRALLPIWSGYVNSNSGVSRALTVPLLDTLWQNTAWDSDSIDLLLTDRGMATRINQLAHSMQRTTNAESASIGFKHIFYRGIPIVADDHVVVSPRQRIWGLNMKYHQVYTKLGRFFKWRPFQTVNDQDTISGKILLAMIYVVSRPRSNGKILDLDSSLT